jgi:putative redox protein
MEIMVDVVQTSETTSEGRARKHRVSCDRPEAKGGVDAGPMGGELFLLGLGGCFMSNLLAAVKARDVRAVNLGVVIRAILDDAPPRFSRVDMQVSGDYPDRREMEKLVLIAERGCIVANTIKGAVALHITVA